MQEIVSKEKCTGCGACYNVCPKSAISIVCDTEGFEHPEINQQTCINCGLCQKVCPVVHADENIEREKAENSVQKAFAARYKKYEKSKGLKSSKLGFIKYSHDTTLKDRVKYFAAYYRNSFLVKMAIKIINLLQK